MMVASALIVTFYFGGYDLPFDWSVKLNELVRSVFTSPNLGNVMAALVFHGVFMAKVIFFLWFFIWVRWTLPRFHYDQLMDLGWKTMLPWALANVLVTALFILFAGGR